METDLLKSVNTALGDAIDIIKFCCFCIKDDTTIANTRQRHWPLCRNPGVMMLC